MPLCLCISVVNPLLLYNFLFLIAVSNAGSNPNSSFFILYFAFRILFRRRATGHDDLRRTE